MNTLESPVVPVARASNPVRLLNRAAVRDRALAIVAQHRPALACKMTRVSADFYLWAQAQLELAMVRRIQAMPSTGKTVR